MEELITTEEKTIEEKTITYNNNNTEMQIADSYVVGALNDTKKSIVDQAIPLINDDKVIKKHAKKLSENADKGIAVELETQELEIKKKDASNKVTKKEIANQLYILRQEAKRIRKQQRHLKQQQKEEHKKENNEAFWNNHGATLSEYKMHQGSNRLFCIILLWLDGLKGFLNGLDKVSNALVKALKWIIIVGLIIGLLMSFPATRNWLLGILGFIK